MVFLSLANCFQCSVAENITPWVRNFDPCFPLLARSFCCVLLPVVFSNFPLPSAGVFLLSSRLACKSLILLSTGFSVYWTVPTLFLPVLACTICCLMWQSMCLRLSLMIRIKTCPTWSPTPASTPVLGSHLVDCQVCVAGNLRATSCRARAPLGMEDAREVFSSRDDEVRSQKAPTQKPSERSMGANSRTAPSLKAKTRKRPQLALESGFPPVLAGYAGSSLWCWSWRARVLGFLLRFVPVSGSRFSELCCSTACVWSTSFGSNADPKTQLFREENPGMLWQTRFLGELAHYVQRHWRA